LSVGSATHINRKSSLNNLTTYKTVKDIKDKLVEEFADIPVGIGTNVTVPATAISNWDNENTALTASSVYSMIKIGGGYRGTDHGQWLLSSYNLSRIGYVGRNNSAWSSIRWIATTDDLTNYMKATKVGDYYGLTTPEGSSSAYIRTTSNGLLPY
jgi:adenosine/AMP kinase